MDDRGTCDGSGPCASFSGRKTPFCEECGRRRLDDVGLLRVACVAALRDGLMEPHEWAEIERFRDVVGRAKWRAVLAETGITAHRATVRVGGALEALEGATAEVTFIVTLSPISGSVASVVSQAWVDLPEGPQTLAVAAAAGDGEWRCSWVRDCSKPASFEATLHFRVSSPWGDGCFEEWIVDPVRIVVRSSVAGSSFHYHDNSSTLLDGREGISKGGISKTVQMGGAPLPVDEGQVRVLEAHVVRVAVRPRLRNGLYRIAVDGGGAFVVALADGVLLGNPQNRQPSHDASFPGHCFLPLLVAAPDGRVDEHASTAVSRNAVQVSAGQAATICRVSILQAARDGAVHGPRMDGRRVATGTVRELGPGDHAIVQVGLPSDRMSDEQVPSFGSPSYGVQVLVRALINPTWLDGVAEGMADGRRLGTHLGGILIVPNWERQAGRTSVCWLLSSISVGSVLPSVDGLSLLLERGRLFCVASLAGSDHRVELPADGTPVGIGRHRLTCRRVSAADSAFFAESRP